MKHKKISTILIVVFVFFVSFANIKSVAAVDSCTWYTYESGLYYDSSTNRYMPVRTYTGNTLTYKLTFDTTGYKFKLSRSDKKFADTVIQDEIYNSPECPKYIGVAYYKKAIAIAGDYVALRADINDYKNYLKTQYNGKVVNESYSSVSYSGTLDSNFNIKADDNDNAISNSICFSNVKTSYKTKLKLDIFDEEVAKEFEEALTGLADKGKTEHYKQEFYNQTKNMWSKAIDQVYSDLASNCSTYENKNTENRKAYLDLIDKDVFPDLLQENNAAPYSKYSSQIPTETCYNSVINAKFMQSSFEDWFRLVDWLVLTSNDDINDFSDFYKFYEFSHIQLDGGRHVRLIRELLNSREKGNKNVDQKYSYQNNICNAICYDYKDTPAYNSCLTGTAVNLCTKSRNQCLEKCEKTSTDSCFTGCMKENYGEQNYNSLVEKYNILQENYDSEISDSLDDMKETLKEININLSGVEFGPYKANCDDVAIFHTLYNILRISAPIIVILFGVVDYGMAVFASDEKKMEESKKKFPKRLLLLVLFVAVPTIVSIILDISGGDANLMRCVINGK